MVAKIRKARRYAVDGFYAIIPSIAILLLPGGPHNVGRAIAKVVIEAFNRPAFFAYPDISYKHFEGHPFLANGNTASSVEIKISRFWIQAPRFHGTPNAMNARSTHAMCDQVATVGSKEASARTGASTAQAWPDHRRGIAAIAGADIAPHITSIGRYVWGCFRNDNQPSKSAADHVYCIRHNGGRSLFMFSGGRHGYNRALSTYCNGGADK